MKSSSPMLFDVREGIESGATFSDCRLYRWTLWRRWDRDLPPVVFVGLNPSTADETYDDPTIVRCIRFAKRWRYGGLIMLNAFGFRATDPKEMQAASDPLGTDNDAAIQLTAQSAYDAGGKIVVAWGYHCPEERERTICELIDRPIHCLGLTKAGRPRHPLYLKASTKPQLFWAPKPTAKP